MTNRELETRYTQMKLTWNNLVNANIDLVDENKMLKEEIEKLNNIIKNVKSQLDYLETYSSKEDVFEDMKRRLDRIESIVNGSDKE